MILWCQVQQFDTEQTPRRHPLIACFEFYSILDHASTTFQLKIKEATTLNGRNLLLIINFIMLI